MSYFKEGQNIKEATQNKTVAVATYQEGAEVIAMALNFYFGETYTKNEAVEMMHKNTSTALKSIAKLAINHEMDGIQLIEYLLEVSEELSAQALVVSIRDELKFDKPTEQFP